MAILDAACALYIKTLRDMIAAGVRPQMAVSVLGEPPLSIRHVIWSLENVWKKEKPEYPFPVSELIERIRKGCD